MMAEHSGKRSKETEAGEIREINDRARYCDPVRHIRHVTIFCQQEENLLISVGSFLYRVFHHLPDLGWVDFDPGSSAICPILLRQMGFGQKWLS